MGCLQKSVIAYKINMKTGGGNKVLSNIYDRRDVIMKTRKRSLKTVRAVFMALLIFLPDAYYNNTYPDTSPGELREKAFQEINSAGQLMKNARALQVPGADKKDLKEAVTIYADAGEKLQRALDIMVELGPEYISNEELDNCNRAIKYCLQAIGSGKRLFKDKVLSEMRE